MTRCTVAPPAGSGIRTFRPAEATQALRDRGVHQAVVLRGRLPAHTADQAHGSHEVKTRTRAVLASSFTAQLHRARRTGAERRTGFPTARPAMRRGRAGDVTGAGAVPLDIRALTQ